MLLRAIPVLHVTDSAAAERFYCDLLGFRPDWIVRHDGQPDPCYMSLTRGGVTLHLSSHADDAVPGGVAFLVVDDVDALHSEFVGRGVAIDLPPTDQTWGNREMYVKDADRNCLRFVNERGC